MIISCPNCGARFRLAAALAQPARMRCAACDHRWVAEPEAEIELPPAPEPPPEPSPLPVAPPPVAPPGVAAPDVAAPAEARPIGPEPEPPAAPASPILRTIAAVILGGALTVAAGALWVARIDPDKLPVLGEQISALAPKPLPLTVKFAARTTELESGDRLLEITGTIRNDGTAAVTLPDLEARLASPSATARRWRIAPPVTSLGAGRRVAFTSTATGFPADATIVAIRPAR